MKVVLIWLMTCSWVTIASVNAHAQPDNQHNPNEKNVAIPKIGEPMPDVLLNGIHHYKRTGARISDFRGRWLILDYWARSCVTGIKNILEIDKLQRKFGTHIQFVLIGDNSWAAFGKDLEGLYERMRRLQGLELPILYDSVMVQRWGIRMMPHVIIIDPQGIVRHITLATELTETKLQALISGEKVAFAPKSHDPLQGVQRYKVTPRGYSSKISLWNGEAQLLVPLDDYIPQFKEAGYVLRQSPLEILYKVAYAGTWYWQWHDTLYSRIYPRVALEVGADSPVRRFLKDDSVLFNYELVLPDSMSTRDKIMSMMQQDLKDVFGVEARLEMREMPVWKVIALPGAEKLLKTKGKGVGDRYYSEGDGGAAGFSYQNWPLSDTFQRIARYIDHSGPPLVDATGIRGNVDITIDAMLTDMDQVKRALQKNKLDLVKSTKRMQVIVITDRTL